MLYVSIDLETTGLNPYNCEVVEFAAVLADTNAFDREVNHLPCFHTYVLPTHGVYQGEPYALSMHGEIFRRVAKKDAAYNYMTQEAVAPAFSDWLRSFSAPYKITPAGKNFGSFDLGFIRENLPGVEPLLSHRVLDPGSMYFNASVDAKLPDLKACLQRAGYAGEVAHTALEDARDVVRVLNIAFMRQRNGQLPWYPTAQ